MGIGPTLSAWKAGVLPLNYTRISVGNINFTLYLVRCQPYFKKNIHFLKIIKISYKKNIKTYI